MVTAASKITSNTVFAYRITLDIEQQKPITHQLESFTTVN